MTARRCRTAFVLLLTSLVSAVAAGSAVGAPIPVDTTTPIPVGPPFRVAEGTANRRAPVIALSDGGDLVVVWEESEVSTEPGLFGRVFDAHGVARSPVFPIATPSSLQAAVVWDDADGFAVVWAVPPPPSGLDNSYVRGRRFDRQGKPDGGEIDISHGHPRLNGVEIVYSPKVAFLGDHFVVVWQRFILSRGASLIGYLAARRVGMDGELMDEVIFVDNFSYANSFDPFLSIPVPVSLDADPKGDFMIAWSFEEGRAQRFNAVGDPLGDSFPIDTESGAKGLSAASGTERAPAVAMDAAGNYSIVWQRAAGGADPHTLQGEGGIYGRWFAADGTPLGPRGRINTTTTGLVRQPVVASDAAGNTTVIWENLGNDGRTNLYGKSFNASDQKLGDEFRVVTGIGDQQNPVVASDSLGNLAVAWENHEVNGSVDVMVRRYRPTPCLPDLTRLCLQDHRFAVEVNWIDFAGQSGTGHATILTPDTGAFWFFADTNLELVVKILDGRDLNGNFWVFYSSMSNVAYSLTVTDMLTGATKTYDNPLGHFASRADTLAFAADPSPVGSESPAQPVTSSHIAADKTGSCDDSEILCVDDERFQVEVSWQDFAGNAGSGRAVRLSRSSGYFWFFNEANIELIIKILDGTALNGHHWIFYGSLSNVAFTITVTDLLTERSKTYVNPLGHFASFGDVTAFPE